MTTTKAANLGEHELSSELPVILIVEDEYPLQGIVEDALTDGGFESDILSSGEEALTLFKGKTKNFKALVTDRPGVSDHLHDRRGCG
jgi:ActR/RegA family two-component response regulator